MNKLFVPIEFNILYIICIYAVVHPRASDIFLILLIISNKYILKLFLKKSNLVFLKSIQFFILNKKQNYLINLSLSVYKLSLIEYLYYNGNLISSKFSGKQFVKKKCL